MKEVRAFACDYCTRIDENKERMEHHEKQCKKKKEKEEREYKKFLQKKQKDKEYIRKKVLNDEAISILNQEGYGAALEILIKEIMHERLNFIDKNLMTELIKELGKRG